MIVDGGFSMGNASLRAHVVIVGGGTMGLYLAAQLLAAGKTVIVAEGGSRLIETASNGVTAKAIGKAHNGILRGHGQGLGGTSVLWGGQLAELERADLHRPGAAWPIGFEELRAYYQETYRRLGITPPPEAEPLDDTMVSQGGTSRDGPSIERFFTTWLPEPNFARLFKKELTSNDRIRVLLETTVNNIHFADGRAVWVGAHNRNGVPLRLEGDAVVVACGTLAANRLMLHLMRQESIPWRHSERVGCCFQDHLGGRAASVRLSKEKLFRGLFENRFICGAKLQPKVRWRTERRPAGSIGVAGLFSFDSEVGENLSNLKQVLRSLRSGVDFSTTRRVPADLFKLGRVLLPMLAHYARERRVMALFDRGLDFHVQAEQIPIDRSRITLSDEGPLDDGMPAISVDWKIDGEEVAQLREFVLAVDSVMRTTGIGELDIDPRLLEANSDFLTALSDTYHACGGLCMSDTPNTGVVDSDNRVWSTRNLYVAGSAVFPSSGHANSTFTALALATRLARHLSVV